MSITLRRYKMLSDFELVSEFLKNNYIKYHKDRNIVQPRWEYAHVHPCFNYQLTHRFGIWEENNEIVGVACYEMDLGECIMMTKIGYESLRSDMLEYAEKELYKSVNNKKKLDVWIFDFEEELAEQLARKGYKKIHVEPVKIYEYNNGFRNIELPEGFSLISLEDENDIQKIHHVLWKGFDHGDEPDDDFDCRLHMQSAPNFRKDLTIIVKAPDGEYACFCGMWLDGKNDFAYIEPLATVPQYRKMGLATIAVTESMKQTQHYGATYCFGGGGEFYSKIGFETICHHEIWSKEWE